MEFFNYEGPLFSEDPIYIQFSRRGEVHKGGKKKRKAGGEDIKMNTTNS